jgi:hypothetical protein
MQSASKAVGEKQAGEVVGPVRNPFLIHCDRTASWVQFWIRMTLRNSVRFLWLLSLHVKPTGACQWR